MKILIDPGHGGDDPGAVYAGMEEEDVTLAVGLRCANVLREVLGHDVFLTRDRDIGIPLVERVRLMNEYKCEAFVSIHCNAATEERVAGIETYYRDTRDKVLAECVQQMLATYTGGINTGAFRDELRLKKRLAVLNNSDKIPCALVEMRYLSNPGDRSYLINNINTLGEVIAHGIDWYAHIDAGRVKEVWPV